MILNTTKWGVVATKPQPFVTLKRLAQKWGTGGLKSVQFVAVPVRTPEHPADVHAVSVHVIITTRPDSCEEWRTRTWYLASNGARPDQYLDGTYTGATELPVYQFNYDDSLSCLPLQAARSNAKFEVGADITGIAIEFMRIDETTVTLSDLFFEKRWADVASDATGALSSVLPKLMKYKSSLIHSVYAPEIASPQFGGPSYEPIPPRQPLYDPVPVAPASPTTGLYYTPQVEQHSPDRSAAAAPRAIRYSSGPPAMPFRPEAAAAAAAPAPVTTTPPRAPPAWVLESTKATHKKGKARPGRKFIGSTSDESSTDGDSSDEWGEIVAAGTSIPAAAAPVAPVAPVAVPPGWSQKPAVPALVRRPSVHPARQAADEAIRRETEERKRKRDSPEGSSSPKRSRASVSPKRESVSPTETRLRTERTAARADAVEYHRQLKEQKTRADEAEAEAAELRERTLADAKRNSEAAAAALSKQREAEKKLVDAQLELIEAKKKLGAIDLVKIEAEHKHTVNQLRAKVHDLEQTAIKTAAAHAAEVKKLKKLHGPSPLGKPAVSARSFGDQSYAYAILASKHAQVEAALKEKTDKHGAAMQRIQQLESAAAAAPAAPAQRAFGPDDVQIGAHLEVLFDVVGEPELVTYTGVVTKPHDKGKRRGMWEIKWLDSVDKNEHRHLTKETYWHLGYAGNVNDWRVVSVPPVPIVMH